MLLVDNHVCILSHSCPLKSYFLSTVIANYFVLNWLLCNALFVRERYQQLREDFQFNLAILDKWDRELERYVISARALTVKRNRYNSFNWEGIFYSCMAHMGVTQALLKHRGHCRDSVKSCYGDTHFTHTSHFIHNVQASTESVNNVRPLSGPLFNFFVYFLDCRLMTNW